MEKQENIVLIDWFSFTLRNLTNPDDAVKLLGLEDLSFENISGMHGYKDRKYCMGISIHFHGKKGMGLWVEMSGEGCRAFESLSYPGLGVEAYDKWQILFGNLLSSPNDYHITRLDVAYDDHTGILNISTLCKDVRAQNFRSLARWWEVVESSEGQSCYLGSPQSDWRLRIYDKARERHCPEGEHWVRVEMQLRDELAESFVTRVDKLGSSFRGSSEALR